jgi:hypothetical protein
VNAGSAIENVDVKFWKASSHVSEQRENSDVGETDRVFSEKAAFQRLLEDIQPTGKAL